MRRAPTGRKPRRVARALVVCAAMFAGCVGPASGQILPSAPSLPSVGGLPSAVGGTVDRARELTSPARLLELRELRLRDFIRANREVIEADDLGRPAVRGEVIAVGPSEAALAAARKAGFTVKSDERLEDLGLRMVVLAVPDGQSARAAVKRLRRLDPQGSYEFNHVYDGSGASVGAVVGAAAGAAVAAGGVRVGLIDSGVAADHPALAGTRVVRQGFAVGGVAPKPHGTAVASLLAGQAGAFRGAAPGATVYAADVYGSQPTGGSAVAVSRALAWMAKERVPVVNVSLVGPPNAALKAAVDALIARGHVVVAAVGNDGPAAPPLYPASYPGVVAVTGVDARSRVLPEAGRGAHVDYAAPGADMAAAGTAGYQVVRGTSFAAPLVAGRLARMLNAPDRAAAERAVASLGREAADLGPKGPDKIYGRGLVAADLRTPPAAVKAGLR